MGLWHAPTKLTIIASIIFMADMRGKKLMPQLKSWE